MVGKSFYCLGPDNSFRGGLWATVCSAVAACASGANVSGVCLSQVHHPWFDNFFFGQSVLCCWPWWCIVWGGGGGGVGCSGCVVLSTLLIAFDSPREAAPLWIEVLCPCCRLSCLTQLRQTVNVVLIALFSFEIVLKCIVSAARLPAADGCLHDSR